VLCKQQLTEHFISVEHLVKGFVSFLEKYFRLSVSSTVTSTYAPEVLPARRKIAWFGRDTTDIAVARTETAAIVAE
jgi:hypothetical protein